MINRLVIVALTAAMLLVCVPGKAAASDKSDLWRRSIMPSQRLTEAI